MALRIGDEAPNFTAQSTEGPIDFHQWIGNQYAILFSHPKDFTPVCTTELGYMARIKPEFDKRNTKILGLSVDSVEDHKKWAKDIQETQGSAPNYPRRCGLQGRQALRHASGQRLRRCKSPHPRRQPDGASGVPHWTGQENQGDADVPDDQRAQFR